MCEDNSCKRDKTGASQTILMIVRRPTVDVLKSEGNLHEAEAKRHDDTNLFGAVHIQPPD